MAQIKNYTNTLYGLKEAIVSCKKFCECTYFCVPITACPTNDSEYALFTDENAANMFADMIGAEVEIDWCFVTID